EHVGPDNRGPTLKKGVRGERVELLAQAPGEPWHLALAQVPEQDGLAVGDVDDLDRVAPDEQPVDGLRPHAAVAAAARAAAPSDASPWKTWPATNNAGTSRTPRSIARA